MLTDTDNNVITSLTSVRCGAVATWHCSCQTPHKRIYRHHTVNDHYTDWVAYVNHNTCLDCEITQRGLDAGLAAEVR